MQKIKAYVWTNGSIVANTLVIAIDIERYAYHAIRGKEMSPIRNRNRISCINVTARNALSENVAAPNQPKSICPSATVGTNTVPGSPSKRVTNLQFARYSWSTAPRLIRSWANRPFTVGSVEPPRYPCSLTNGTTPAAVPWRTPPRAPEEGVTSGGDADETRGSPRTRAWPRRHTAR